MNKKQKQNQICYLNSVLPSEIILRILLWLPRNSVWNLYQTCVYMNGLCKHELLARPCILLEYMSLLQFKAIDILRHFDDVFDKDPLNVINGYQSRKLVKSLNNYHVNIVPFLSTQDYLLRRHNPEMKAKQVENDIEPLLSSFKLMGLEKTMQEAINYKNKMEAMKDIKHIYRHHHYKLRNYPFQYMLRCYYIDLGNNLRSLS